MMRTSFSSLIRGRNSAFADPKVLMVVTVCACVCVSISDNACMSVSARSSFYARMLLL